MELLANLWKHRARQRETAVRRAVARLDDPRALEHLLAGLPEAEDLRSRLHGPFFARAWDVEAQLDHWIESDGARVTCYTVSGLSLPQAAAVRVRWDALRGRAELNEALLADLIARETGSAVTLEG
ncbi:MAG: hypothetical protein ACREU3_11300 [Steroidobacteraceae bacterium]